MYFHVAKTKALISCAVLSTAQLICASVFTYEAGFDMAQVKKNFFISSQTMYDLLMDMLDERGISNDFVVKLVDFCTSYEHDQYVSFLEKFKAVLKE